MDVSLLKTKLKSLVADFLEKDALKKCSESEIQSLFTIDLLKEIGWQNKNITINRGPDVKTGKIPDILLQDDSSNTIMIIESKHASNVEILDGKYQSKSFVEQLFGYSKAEGIWWGVLTNFVEWRVYSVYQNRLYENKKYAFHDLLWKNADKSKYVDMFSDEGISFLLQLSKDSLSKTQGRWSSSTVYYPHQEEIKQDFFLKLKSWRANLRSNIRKSCTDKSSIGEIDLMTQKILDRLIFIDYCADNLILSQNRLSAILHSRQNKWKELKRIFAEMNERFNTELFSSSPCDSLDINDETIFPIIQELAAIDFKKLSVHIIGEVYENYLGELLQKSHGGIKVDEASSSKKKKSQGIYYTPEYIVDYIVENTVGALLARCETETEIDKIRVLDPSCGSGSFLIKVFDEFKKHYMRVNKNQTNLFEFEIRKKILRNNVFGVDLDARAVEIAKLNLMIKALEGLNWQDIKGKKLLPSLELNIRHGNSLVSGDLSFDESSIFFKEIESTIEKLNLFRKKYASSTSDIDKETALKEIWINEQTINSKANKSLLHHFKKIEDIFPFNYPSAFPEVFEDGGFDIVLGNPPYLNVELVSSEQKLYFANKYTTFFKRYDVFGLFFEVALKSLINETGQVAFIVPQQIFNNLSYRKLRDEFLNNNQLQEVCYLGDKVFLNASNDVCILFLKKPSVNKIRLVNALDFSKPILHEVQTDYFNKYNNIISFSNDSKDESIFSKIFDPKHFRVKEKYHVFQGIVTGNNPAFMPTDDQIQSYKIEKELLHSILLGRDFEKWSIRSIERKIIYLNQDIDIADYPNTEKWLSSFKAELSKRRECKNGVIPWYSLQWPRDKQHLDFTPKILVQNTRNPRLKNRIVATMDEIGVYGTQGLNVIIGKEKDAPIYFLLGVLNSSLINHLFTTKFLNMAIKAEYLKEIPIPISTKSDISAIDKLVRKALKTKNEIELSAIEREINKKVFDLYSLSGKEIETIES